MRSKRKLFTGNKPIGSSNTDGKVLKSRRLAREITSKYHVIQNELDLLNKKMSEKMTTDEKKQTNEKIQALKQDMNDIGGIDRYQQVL